MSIPRDAEAKIDDYKWELELAYQQYVAKVEMIAAKARHEILIPYLRPMGWEFTQGNGTWSITDQAYIDAVKARGDSPWHFTGWDKTDHIARIVDEALRLEVAGAYGNPELALWMIDYTTRKTKNQGGSNA